LDRRARRKPGPSAYSARVGNERDLELLRGAYAEWGRGDFTHDYMWDPETQFIISGVEQRTYVGPGGVKEGWFDFLGAWEDFRVEGVDFIEGKPNDTYLVLVHLRGRGKGSRVPTEADTANVAVVRDGKIVRFELFWERDAALEAAGLAP
jgi:ketosteroid isomerase-like protein